MATAARDRLARTLRGDAQAAFSVELTARTEDLSLEVEGFGPVKLPVTPAKARKLLGLGQPARFGRGEETLTDPDVRDTWEIPRRLVRAEWDAATLKDVLATVKQELGLPNGAGLTAELDSFLVSRYYGGLATDPPNRLVYLLDHEYTPRGLTWRRLKGADARRVSLLRAAAGRTGGEAVLALADIRTTHTAFAADEVYGYRDWYEEDDDEHFGGASGGGGEYEIQDLIDSEVTLTHWTGPEGTRLEETSLHVDRNQVCASTPTGDLAPYSSEYEGYMGNWGNTLDRWYHRAAVIVWPREQAFANRAETSPAWALDEIAAMASAGDVPGARVAAATLAPFWETALGGRTPEDRGRVWTIFGPALRAADVMADAPTAAMLLRPFHIEDLDHESVDSFGKIAGRYGQPWTAELVRTWFGGDQPAWAYGGGQERPRWIADRLPGLCARLHASGRAGAAAAQRLVDLAWEWTAKAIGTGLASSSPSRRDEKLGDLGRPLASVLTAAAAIGAAGPRDTVTGHVRKQGNAVTALEMSALRAAADLPRDGARGQDGFGDLAADCATRLRARLARPRRASGDWSIGLPAGGCTCELCGTLRAFLEDTTRRTFQWPLAKERRQHVHSRIDGAELPVTHVTRRQGRPYTLVLTKTDALFAREQEARARDETDLEWLSAQWNPVQ
jgi:hypothetical protein